MSPLQVNLSDLITQVETDLPDTDALGRLSEARRRAQALEGLGDQLVGHFTAQARASGGSWSQIGDAMGVSKQAAQRRWAAPTVEHFSSQARRVTHLAQGHARSWRHGAVGTEHLLLGLLDQDAGGMAFEILDDLAGSADAAGAAITDALIAGTESPARQIPWTPQALDVLATGARQARKTGHGHIGTEHLLLALLAHTDGLAYRILTRLGIAYDPVKNEIVTRLDALGVERRYNQ